MRKYIQNVIGRRKRGDVTLDRENMLHHGHDTERLFGNEEWERKLKNAEKKGYEEGVRNERRRAARERRKHVQQKKEAIELILFFIGVTFVARLLYIFAARHIKLVDDGWFWAWIGVIVTGIFKACTGDKELTKDTRGNRSAFQSVLSGMGEFWKDIHRNNKLFCMFVLCIACLTGGVLGKFNVLERTVSATTEFGNVWINYENKSLKETNNDEEREQSVAENEEAEGDRSDAGNCKTETEQISELNESNGTVDVSDKSLTNESVTFIEESDYSVEDLRRIAISEDELVKTLYLSSEEYGSVFLAGEENAVEDWDNQEEINNTVLQMIEDQRKKRKPNLFDDETTPQYVKDEINNASEDEKNVNSFMEIERIQQVRTDVYGDYPKKGIANLIANSEQLKALVLYYYCARQQTILYHYGQSILWESEYLSYEDTLDNEVSKRLSKIARRYEDIAFACKDCTESMKAKKLQTAYENAAEQYRGVTDDENR